MGRKGKLTNEEISRALEKIRQRYCDYIVNYMKPPSVREDFESRYLHALRTRADMTFFLHTEFSILEELIRREEEKRSQRLETEKEKKQGGQNKKPDFADKIIEQHRKQIEKYPEIELPGPESYELRKLFGMLIDFDREHWPLVSSVLRDFQNLFSYGLRNRLESEENELALVRSDGIPPVLHRYTILISMSPKDWKAVELEQNKCVLAAAFFLHRVKRVCERMLETGTLEEDRKKSVEKILDFLHSVINDFRLKDLKPQELEEL
jgi:hypothetical protein